MSERTIPWLVRQHVERDPDFELFRFRDLSVSPSVETALTYGSLWQQAEAFAERVAPGEQVVLILPLGLRLLAAQLGCLLGGAVPSLHGHPSAKMTPESYARSLGHVLQLISPDLVITNREIQPVVEAASAERTRVVTEEAVAHAPAGAVQAWEKTDARQPALVQYSSGSTGLKKGVALSHTMIDLQCREYAIAIDANPATDRICSWLPLYHDMGLFTSWLLPLLRGIAVSAIDPFAWVQQPASILSLITEHRGTLCWQPNFAYQLLATRVGEAELTGLDLSSMRGFINCGEPVRAASQRAFAQRFEQAGLTANKLWICYAMAENSFAVCGALGPQRVLRCDPTELSHGRFAPAAAAEATELVSVGAPIAQCRVRVVDARRVSVADGQVGEIAVSSPYTIDRYLNNAEATRAAIDADGWFHTGDLGFLLEGELYVTGRDKDLLILGGRNFYPQDIEALVDGCPHAVPGRCVAIGVTDEQQGTERIVVIVESHAAGDDQAVSALLQSVRRDVFGQLDCQVSEVLVVPHMWLEKTSSGKIARQPNLARYREQFAAPLATVDKPSWALTVGWSMLLAALLYLYLVLRPDVSWGIYSRF